MAACGGFIYVVRAGDTFAKLATRFGVSVAAIQAANPGVNLNTLRIGMSICIPGGSAPTCSGFVYTIKAGDTYGALARQFGVSVASIRAANPGVNPNALMIGQNICIPQRPFIDCPDGQIYIVEAGDTMSGIARKFGISLNMLEDANPQIENPDVLTIGENLCVPVPPRA